MSREPIIYDEDIKRTLLKAGAKPSEAVIRVVRNAYATGFYEGHKAGCEDTMSNRQTE